MTRYSYVIMGGKTFTVDISQTDYARQKGLSGKESLLEDRGMLFIFPKEDRYGIWMKDMKFPIDIIWIDANSKIISIEKSVLPDTYPKVFYPTVPALYVFEISAGEVEKLNVKIGDSIKIERN